MEKGILLTKTKDILRMTRDGLRNNIFRRYFYMTDDAFMKRIDKRNHLNLRNVTYDNKKTVLFVVEYVTPRMEKMGKALNKAGLDVVVLLSYIPSGAKAIVNEQDISAWAKLVVKFADFLQLSRYIIDINPKVVHYFTRAADVRNTAIVLRHKSLFPPIVIERYDILLGLYRIPQGDKKMEYFHRVERYIFEQSDGIVAREFSLPYLEDKVGVKFPNNKLVFLDYIDKLMETDEFSDDEVQLYYAGFVITERCNPERTEACNLEFSRMCENNNCHYHYYPSQWKEDELQDFIRMDKTNPYYHLHHPVINEKLLDEVKHYDALVVASKGTYEEIRNKTNDPDYYSEKFLYAGTNKYFDAFAAGLPIIAVHSEKLLDALSEHGVVLRWTLDEIDFDYLKEHRDELKAKVRAERDYWLMDNRIKELIDFYNQVVDDTKR